MRILRVAACARPPAGSRIAAPSGVRTDNLKKSRRCMVYNPRNVSIRGSSLIEQTCCRGDDMLSVIAALLLSRWRTHMKSAVRPIILGTIVLPILLMAALRAQTDRAAACAGLATQQLPNTTITTAQAITTGSFTPPGSTNAMTNLPPFCRVAGTIAPTSESQILFEVWLPLDNWNGKFAGVGNGGWAGTISYGQVQDQVR